MGNYHRQDDNRPHPQAPHWGGRQHTSSGSMQRERGRQHPSVDEKHHTDARNVHKSKHITLDTPITYDPHLDAGCPVTTIIILAVRRFRGTSRSFFFPLFPIKKRHEIQGINSAILSVELLRSNSRSFTA